MTFDFTMDVLPGYTLFDNTTKVMCVFQILDDPEDEANANTDSVMKHGNSFSIGSSVTLNGDNVTEEDSTSVDDADKGETSDSSWNA